MTYRAPVWPLRVENGDFVTGDRSEVTRSDVAIVVEVRKFIDINTPGEYVMRPNAFSEVPTALIAQFDPYLIGPLTEAFLLGALSHLELSGKIMITSFHTTVITGGVLARVDYKIPETGERDSYEYIMPSSPSGAAAGSGRTP